MSKLIIAGAGTGKTTYLVKEALKLNPSSVLITTFTDANEANIKDMFIHLNGCIPPNVTILTWFSFLIAHGINPYKSYLTEKTIRGITMNPSDAEKIKYMRDDDERKYISESGKLYSVSLSKGACKINESSNGIAFKRIGKIFSHIFIDEVQDLSGYDLEIIAKLSKLNCELQLVGDPRQTTFQTHYETKNKRYNNGKICDYIRDKNLSISIDDFTLSETYRCNPVIIQLANSMYPNYTPTKSNRISFTGHDGIFWVNENYLELYVEMYSPTCLRYAKNTEIPNFIYNVMNFGNSKGLTFDRTLIFPTESINEWFISKTMKPVSLAKFYVAVTRARYSVGIVYSGLFPPSEEFGIIWCPPSEKVMK